MKNINRRENPRVEIKLRCHVTAPSPWAQSAAHTENISRNGLLIAWRNAEMPAVGNPRVGQLLTVQIELPAHHGFGQKCIHCQGTVVRVATPEATAVRVALSLNYMDFRSYEDRYNVVHPAPAPANRWMA